MTRRNKFKNDIEYESCINCGGVTDIPKNMDVSVESIMFWVWDSSVQIAMSNWS